MSSFNKKCKNCYQFCTFNEGCDSVFSFFDQQNGKNQNFFFGFVDDSPFSKFPVQNGYFKARNLSL